jgi:hypothetical protein
MLQTHNNAQDQQIFSLYVIKYLYHIGKCFTLFSLRYLLYQSDERWTGFEEIDNVLFKLHANLGFVLDRCEPKLNYLASLYFRNQCQI